MSNTNDTDARIAAKAARIRMLCERMRAAQRTMDKAAAEVEACVRTLTAEEAPAVADLAGLAIYPAHPAGADWPAEPSRLSDRWMHDVMA